MHTMKKIIFAFMGILLIGTACKKSVILGTPDELGTDGAYLTLTEQGNIQIAPDPASSVSIKVGSVGQPVASVNIYVVRGQDLNKANWKLIKNVPFSDGVELNVTAPEIATALGVPLDDIKGGDVFTFYNEAVTVAGKMFSLANITTDFESQAPFNMAMQWSALGVCAFDPAPFTGNFAVNVDEWQDFAVGDVVTSQAGPGANQITLTVYPSPAFGTNRQPFIVDVDPATGAATVASQVIGDYPGFDTNLKVETVGTANFVFGCTGHIQLTLNFTGDGGDYGDYLLVLEKL